MTALCSGKICTIFPEKGALNFWKACTIALEYSIEFTKLEYEIIELLSTHPGQVFDKERIYEITCGYDAEGDSRVITELIRRIRKKIGNYSDTEYIETVWGMGYKWKK